MSDTITFDKILAKDKLLLEDWHNVTVTKMKHIVEVQYLEHSNTENPIVKLNKDEYYCKYGADAGEIKRFNHIENRSQSYSSLKQTFKKIRYLVNNNFSGNKNELFITLTYAENMQDTKRLYRDFDVFIKRMRRVYKDFDYLNIIEPQGRGAWHCHVLFRFNDRSCIYIDNKWLSERWGQGFVNIHRIQNCDNIGAYLTAYLADIDLDDVKNENELLHKLMTSDLGYGVIEKDVNGRKKRFVKGGRLCLYPVGLNIYRKSRGIKMPDRKKMTYLDCKKNIVNSAQADYISGLELFKDDEHFNKIVYEHYNLKRAQNQQ